MKVSQKVLKNGRWSDSDLAAVQGIAPNLVFMFGARNFFEKADWTKQSKNLFKDAIVIGCTTAGEISNDGVFDESIVVTGVHFDKTKLKPTFGELKGSNPSIEAGRQIGANLKAADLKCVFVLGQGVNINGTDLVEGIKEKVGGDVVITGGLAGDAARFEKTFTLLGESVYSDKVAAVGFYGNALEISFGSQGGWEPFGPVRRVTKSNANILFEIDGKRALDVYKEYLGADAKGLPGSGLLYPLAMLKDNNATTGLIRTLLGIDEKAGSLTLAGDIPQGSLVRLMHTDSKGLVLGARNAADEAQKGKKSGTGDKLGLLVSCVGRKLVMGDDVDEEVDAVLDVLGDNATVTGFYSYGEICPILGAHEVKLHNQTMTITFLQEK